MINALNLIDFHEFIYFYVMQALVRKAAEIPEDKREHLPNYLNQRLVTIGRQERDEGQEAPQDPERRLHR